MLKINNLYFSYNNLAPYILNNINLTIKDGEYVSILGENGCGKSTLIKLILNILSPTSGTIVNDAKNVGYVAQKSDFLNSDFPITVYEMLDCYRKILKIKDKKIVEKSLDRVSMLKFKNSLIGNLSGGQCQKVFIARALMGNPHLLILDEPSTGVDIKSQREIYSLIKSLNRDTGITVISIEHNLKAAISNSSLIYHIANGNGHMCKPETYINEYVEANGGNKFYV
ncbi:metal ABC transporter ATP-binding protein [Clostridium fermenticellae]|uniref:Metal ABC transporter ATP-binding protein n=1 Tax=Clostridium fermenticellae TaxID=2068654 RepID=A0A386H2N7_9CLOT|nr:metal ABC transporter ATP-binding protein [Clostridium fermenticellae]AYD39926.1 metal ABC transporter ATP-binding protein [Clostridium fermenticellae]